MSGVWADSPPSTVFLVGKRPPLSTHPPFWQWLARLVYKRLHWCPDFGIEYQGVFTNEAEARHAASAPGMFYMELPLDAELPAEPCQFGVHDFPHSDASPFYRRRKAPYVAVPRTQMERLERSIQRAQSVR